MARVSMVTRTITSSEISVIALDVNTCEVVKTVHVLFGEMENNDKTLKKVQDTFNTSTVKIVSIESIKTITSLYGMSESDFIAHAKILPSRS